MLKSLKKRAIREEQTKIVKNFAPLNYGPLCELIENPSCSEILVDGHNQIQYEAAGRIHISKKHFRDEAHFLKTIKDLFKTSEIDIDENTIFSETILRDGNYINVTCKPNAKSVCSVVILKPPTRKLSVEDLIKFNCLTQEMANFLKLAVEAPKNILVSGGAGSGKLTILRILCEFIGEFWRVSVCARPINNDVFKVIDGDYESINLQADSSSIKEIVQVAQKIKSDRIVMDECQNEETLEFLHAMNNGFDGSISSVHANSPEDCIDRLRMKIEMCKSGLSPKSIEQLIRNSVDIIIQQERLIDGSRKIVRICEVIKSNKKEIELKDIFVFKRRENSVKPKIEGAFLATGHIPGFISDLRQRGCSIPKGLFDNDGVTQNRS